MKKKWFHLSLIAAVVSLFLINDRLFASEPDERIESSAKKSYVFKTYLKGDDVTIQSKMGAVTLSGTVSEDSHKALAKETVASLPGVKSVDNKLEIKRDAPAAFSDAWLITKVKATLLFHQNVNATKTEVLSQDGTVTLRGEAASAAQRDLTSEYAKDVEGVKTVINEMVVSTAAMPSGETAVGKNMDKIGKKMEAIGDLIDDASITALVKTTLLYHRSTSALNTTVETKNGVVKLGGSGKNAAESDLVSKLVSDVHGVKKVVNNMTVGVPVSKTI